MAATSSSALSKRFGMSLQGTHFTLLDPYVLNMIWEPVYKECYNDVMLELKEVIRYSNCECSPIKWYDSSHGWFARYRAEIAREGRQSELHHNDWCERHRLQRMFEGVRHNPLQHFMRLGPVFGRIWRFNHSFDIASKLISFAEEDRRSGDITNLDIMCNNDKFLVRLLLKPHFRQYMTPHMLEYLVKLDRYG